MRLPGWRWSSSCCQPRSSLRVEVDDPAPDTVALAATWTGRAAAPHVTAMVEPLFGWIVGGDLDHGLAGFEHAVQDGLRLR